MPHRSECRLKKFLQTHLRALLNDFLARKCLSETATQHASCIFWGMMRAALKLTNSQCVALGKVRDISSLVISSPPPPPPHSNALLLPKRQFQMLFTTSRVIVAMRGYSAQGQELIYNGACVCVSVCVFLCMCVCLCVKLKYRI